MPLTVSQMLKRHKVNAFRRLSLKRRLDDSSGDYESSWFDISEDVKNWGNIHSAIDDEQYSFFQPDSVSIVVKNDRGQFYSEEMAGSYWHGHLTDYKTLIKINAGFKDPTSTNATEIPTEGATVASTSIQFLGILTEAIEHNSENNESVLNVRGLYSVLEDVPANLLVVASAGAAGSGQLTASGLITRMRNMTDGSSNFILRRFITSTNWDIDTTTQTLTTLDTTTALDSYDCWELAKKLAEVSGNAVWVDRLGVLKFKAKTESSAVNFTFAGIPYNNATYGHTIKALRNIKEDMDFLYNRVRVKFGDADTSTSFKTKQEIWVVGDSSTSWKYGVRTLEIENNWMNSTTADNIASTLYTSLNVLTDKVEVSCRFIPTLNLLDKTTIEYDSAGEGGTRWDLFNWDAANWDRSLGAAYNFTAKFWKIIGLEHDLNRLETNVVLRSV